MDAERVGRKPGDTEAESRVLRLEAKEGQGLINTRSWEEAKDILPHRGCQHFDFRLVDSRTETKSSYGFKLLSLWYFVGGSPGK